MASITIELPDLLRKRLEERAAEEGYADVAHYVRGLILGDSIGAPDGLALESDESLAHVLKERMNGPFVDVTPEDLRSMRGRIEKQLGL